MVASSLGLGLYAFFTGQHGYFCCSCLVPRYTDAAEGWGTGLRAVASTAIRAIFLRRRDRSPGCFSPRRHLLPGADCLMGLTARLSVTSPLRGRLARHGRRRRPPILCRRVGACSRCLEAADGRYMPAMDAVENVSRSHSPEYFIILQRKLPVTRWPSARGIGWLPGPSIRLPAVDSSSRTAASSAEPR